MPALCLRSAACGACFEAALVEVKTADGVQFKAKGGPILD